MKKLKLYITVGGEGLYIQHPSGFVECDYTGDPVAWIESGISPSKAPLDEKVRHMPWAGKLEYIGEL